MVLLDLFQRKQFDYYENEEKEIPHFFLLSETRFRANFVWKGCLLILCFYDQLASAWVGWTNGLTKIILKIKKNGSYEYSAFPKPRSSLQPISSTARIETEWIYLEF